MKVQILFIAILISFTFTVFNTSYSQSEDGVLDEMEEVPKIIPNFASEFTEDGKGFDIEYFLSADLDPNIIIDDKENSLTFSIVGKIELEDEWLIVMIPPEVLEFPMLVYVDGQKEPQAILSIIEGTTTMFVPLSEDSKEVKIIGVRVIPEFGSIATLILVISIISIIILSSTKKSPIRWLR
jgi:predicted secreted protein with PEFG-CTERM motif